MPLSLSVFSQSGPPICTPIWAFFRAFKALRALKGPQIKFSHILMHRLYRDILNLKFSCLYLFPFSHKVVPQKASGGGGVGGGSYTTLQLVNILGVATFFFFFFFLFFNPGENWTKNRLRMVSKVRNVRLGVFSGGGCHHPNSLCKNCSKSDITVLKD